MSDLTYRVVIRLCRVLFRALGLRIDIRGVENVPTRGPAVLASNHVSFLDFMFVGLAGVQRGRFIRFLAKQPVFRPPLVGAAMRAMGHICVDRRHGEVALRHAVRAVEDGELVGLFPEATISRSWELKDYRPGAAAVAIWQQVPLLPVVVWGAQRVLTVDRRFSLRRGKAITIVVGQPLRLGREVTPAEGTARLRAAMQVLLAEAMATYPDRPRDDRDRWWVPASAGGSAPRPAVAAEMDARAMARADR
ncbi:MAG: 1-acyl-sn-glycerol-3-phosphate acyltransferase [Actinomycetota bacterium]|nr:1-acyl-sn-glycerol-3-phosphate acyltransferase [Actinomycetota bacterium]